MKSQEFEENHERFLTPDFLLIKSVWKDHQMIHCFPYTALFLVSLILILTKKGTKKLIVIIDRFVVHRFTLEHERFFDVTAIMDNVSTNKAFKIFDMEFIIIYENDLTIRAQQNLMYLRRKRHASAHSSYEGWP
ncbi:hypothetical protein GQX74_004151 [Glossina fuscipes]|nr:hypothetical protein GQX74_004151 [Glossina fuscipes]